jgi:hypothetical protein
MVVFLLGGGTSQLNQKQQPTAPPYNLISYDQWYYDFRYWNSGWTPDELYNEISGILKSYYSNHQYIPGQYELFPDGN